MGGKDKDTGGHTGGGNNGGDRDPGQGGGNVNLKPVSGSTSVCRCGGTVQSFTVRWRMGIQPTETQKVQSFITKSITKVKTLGIPTVGTLWRTSLWGLVVEGITPTKIAPDDMSMVRHIVTTLPCGFGHQTPPGQLPTNRQPWSALVLLTPLMRGSKSSRCSFTVVTDERSGCGRPSPPSDRTSIR